MKGLDTAGRTAADMFPNVIPYPSIEEAKPPSSTTTHESKLTAALPAKPNDPPKGWSEAQKADLNFSMAQQLENTDGTCSGYLRAAALYTSAAAGFNEGDARKKRALESAERLTSAAIKTRNQNRCPESQTDSGTHPSGRASPANEQEWASTVKKARLSFLLQLKSEIASLPPGEKRATAIGKFQEVAKSLLQAPIPPKGSLREQALLQSLRMAILGENGQDMSSIK